MILKFIEYSGTPTTPRVDPGYWQASADDGYAVAFGKDPLAAVSAHAVKLDKMAHDLLKERPKTK